MNKLSLKNVCGCIFKMSIVFFIILIFCCYSQDCDYSFPFSENSLADCFALTSSSTCCLTDDYIENTMSSQTITEDLSFNISGE